MAIERNDVAYLINRNSKEAAELTLEILGKFKNSWLSDEFLEQEGFMARADLDYCVVTVQRCDNKVRYNLRSNSANTEHRRMEFDDFAEMIGRILRIWW